MSWPNGDDVSPLRVVIVDDERLAREKLRRLLTDAETVCIVGEASNGEEAVRRIRSERPDVVFLDVQMPGMDGFEVVEGLAPEDLPAVVFVTAHDEHALRAFDVEAIDYVLKPFDRARLRQALERVRRRLGAEPMQLVEKLRRLLGAGTDSGSGLRRIAVRSGGRIRSLKVDEIEWFEAADNYSRIHSAGAAHLVRETLSALERRLNPSLFIRIHRSAIVRIESIREVESLFHGDYQVVLSTGKRLAVGRKYRDRLVESLGGRAAGSGET